MKNRFCIGLIVAGVAGAAWANYEWRGATGEWSTSAANWWDGSALVPWADGVDADMGTSGTVTGIEVASGGVSVGVYQVLAGASYALGGGPVATTTLAVGGNDNGTSPASLTINNAVSASGAFNFKGGVTIANGGSLTVNAYTPKATASAGVDTAKVTVLAGGTLEVTNFPAEVANNYSTLYFDGGTVKHALTNYKEHRSFSNSKIVVGPGGMHVREAKYQQSFLPYPIASGGDDDGGLWLEYHRSELVLYGNNTFKGGTHIAGTTGSIRIQTDSNLGAVPSSPANNIFFEGDGTTKHSAILQAFNSGGTTYLNPNRNILIGDKVVARLDAYTSSQTLVIRSAIDCEDRQTGALRTGGFGTGTVVLEPTDGRTNHLGRLFVNTSTIIGRGTTLVENNKALEIGTGANDERWSVNYGSPLNISDYGHLMVTGGVLTVMGGRMLCNSARLTVSRGGFMDLSGHEFLHGYNGAATTTVRDGGKLVVSTVRMAGDNGAYFRDPTKSVMNIETGGVLRVTNKLYITDSAKRGTLCFNGGMLDWASVYTSYLTGSGSYQTESKVGLLVTVKEGGMVVSNDVTFYVEQPVRSDAAHDGGITKWGTGEMALANPTNTFNGPIRVMQGRFATWGALRNPLNTNCTVCVNENTSFRANTSYHTFARIEGSGSFTQNTDYNFTVWQAIAPGMGTNSIGTLTVSDGPVNILDGVALEIDVDAAGNSDCFSCPCELDLSKMSLRVNDLAKLNTEKKYVIASNLMDATGDFASSNLPNGWFTRYDAAQHKLILYFQRGTVIMVR